MPKITKEDNKFQSPLCLIKKRWGRFLNCNPHEQEIEAEDIIEGREIPKTWEDLIVENESKEIYNPISNTLDFRRQKAADLLDNPRVYLP